MDFSCPSFIESSLSFLASGNTIGGLHYAIMWSIFAFLHHFCSIVMPLASIFQPDYRGVLYPGFSEAIYAYCSCKSLVLLSVLDSCAAFILIPTLRFALWLCQVPCLFYQRQIRMYLVLFALLVGVVYLSSFFQFVPVLLKVRPQFDLPPALVSSFTVKFLGQPVVSRFLAGQSPENISTLSLCCSPVHLGFQSTCPFVDWLFFLVSSVGDRLCVQLITVLTDAPGGILLIWCGLLSL